MKSAKQLTRALYTREQDFWRRLTALRTHVESLQSTYAPTVVGYARVLGETFGVRPDGWLEAEAEVRVTVLGAVDRVEVDATYPHNHPLPATFRLTVADSSVELTLTLGGRFSLSLNVAIEAGQSCVVRLECDRSISPAAAGYGRDEGARSCRLDELRLVPR
jgi:hypothetical protein